MRPVIVLLLALVVGGSCDEYNAWEFHRKYEDHDAGLSRRCHSDCQLDADAVYRKCLDSLDALDEKRPSHRREECERIYKEQIEKDCGRECH